MINEVLKSNIELREANKDLADKYEKERAKVYQLNFEMEKKKRTELAKNKTVVKLNKTSNKLMKLRTPDNYSKVLSMKSTGFKINGKGSLNPIAKKIRNMKNNFVNLPKYNRAQSRNNNGNRTINDDINAYSNGFASVMQKRPERLKLLEHNNSHELQLEQLDTKNETKTIISDANSQVSHLFPHVTRRKKDEYAKSIDEYTTKEVGSVKTSKQIGKKSNTLANLNFVFQ